MPTPYEYAVMSAAVYKPNGGTPPDGWKIWVDSDKLQSSQEGYYACAYYNPTTREVVISHRGTTFCWANIKSDLSLLVHQEPAAQQFADHFSSEIERSCSKHGCTLSHTGHSLGAIHAELCAVSQNIEAVTFESPGSETISSHRLTDRVPPSTIVNYLGDKNPFNSADKHIGQIIYLDVVTDPEEKRRIQNMADEYFKLLTNFGQKIALGGIASFELWLTVINFILHNVTQITRYHLMDSVLTTLNPAIPTHTVPRSITEAEWLARSTSGVMTILESSHRTQELLHQYRSLNPGMSKERLNLLVDTLIACDQNIRENPLDFHAFIMQAKVYLRLHDDSRMWAAMKHATQVASSKTHLDEITAFLAKLSKPTERKHHHTTSHTGHKSHHGMR
jgi:hypothetical protein